MNITICRTLVLMSLGSGITPALADGPTALQLQQTLAAGQKGPISLSALGGVARGTPSNPGDPLDYNTIVISGQKYLLSDALKLFVQASGGDITNTSISAQGESSNRPEGNRIGDIYNLADHGARGDAITDDSAMTKAIAFATIHSGTHIFIPTGMWAFTVGSLFGFQLPSNTTIEGADAGSTGIVWNDTSGYYLFTATSNSPGAPRTKSIAFRNFTVAGTWGTPTSGFSAWQIGNNALIPGGVDGLIIENVTSVNSRGFGFAARESTDVVVRNNHVLYAYSDGINVSQSSNLTISNNVILHTDDDGISAHSDIYDTWSVRRNVSIINNTLFDTQGIDVLGARNLVVSGNNLDTVRQKGIAIATVPPNTSTEGNSSTDSVVVTGNKITNLLNRLNIDNQNQNVSGISVVGLSARAGNYAAIPGDASPSTGKVVDPYPEFLANSTLASIPTAGGARILISNNLIARTLPASNGSDPRFTNWSSFNQGLITSRLGPQNPSLSESDMQGPGVYLSGGDLRDVLITGNLISGLSYGLAIDGSGHMADIVFRGNIIEDATLGGIMLNTQGSAELVADSNFFNLDPYQKSSSRGLHGTWKQSGPIALLRVSGGNVLAQHNIILNSSGDTNVDPTDPTSGWLFEDNVDEGDPTVIDAFSTSNRGVGLIHSGGFRLIQMDSDPSSPTYDTVLSVPITAATTMPTKGFWIPGERVTNLAINASQPYSEWIRATVGTGSTLGLDWFGIPVQISRVSNRR